MYGRKEYCYNDKWVNRVLDDQLDKMNISELNSCIEKFEKILKKLKNKYSDVSHDYRYCEYCDAWFHNSELLVERKSIPFMNSRGKLRYMREQVFLHCPNCKISLIGFNTKYLPESILEEFNKMKEYNEENNNE